MRRPSTLIRHSGEGRNPVPAPYRTSPNNPTNLRNRTLVLSQLEYNKRAHADVSSLPRRVDRGRQNGIVAMIRARLAVIPSAARNLKSIAARPDSRYHVYLMNNKVEQRKNFPSRLYFRTDTLDSSIPLRCAQNDSDGAISSSMESGSIVKYLPPVSPLWERARACPVRDTGVRVS